MTDFDDVFLNALPALEECFGATATYTAPDGTETAITDAIWIFDRQTTRQTNQGAAETSTAHVQVRKSVLPAPVPGAFIEEDDGTVWTVENIRTISGPCWELALSLAEFRNAARQGARVEA